MTDYEALACLVESGEQSGTTEKWRPGMWQSKTPDYPTELFVLLGKALDNKINPQCIATAIDGSLDAARSLHEALLPNKDVGISINRDGSAVVTIPHWVKKEHGQINCEKRGIAGKPSTAWVAAILRAKADLI